MKKKNIYVTFLGWIEPEYNFSRVRGVLEFSLNICHIWLLCRSIISAQNKNIYFTEMITTSCGKQRNHIKIHMKQATVCKRNIIFFNIYIYIKIPAISKPQQWACTQLHTRIKSKYTIISLCDTSTVRSSHTLPFRESSISLSRYCRETKVHLLFSTDLSFFLVSRTPQLFVILLLYSTMCLFSDWLIRKL